MWGLSNILNVFGARWFITFIDYCTRVTWVFLLKQKSKVSSVQFFFRFNLVLELRGLDLIMILIPFVVKRVSFMNHLVSKHPNKMGLLKGKMGTYLTKLGIFSLNIRFPNLFVRRLIACYNVS